MTFQTVKELTDAVKPAASVLSDRVSVTNPSAVSDAVVEEFHYPMVGLKTEVQSGSRRD